MPKNEEYKLEQRFVRLVEKRGGEALKLEVKSRRGWPDRLVIMKNGLVVFVELKKDPSQSLAPLQVQRRKRLKELDQLTYVVSGEKSMRTFFTRLDEMDLRARMMKKLIRLEVDEE